MKLEKWLLIRKWASDRFNDRKEEWGNLSLLDDEPFWAKRNEEVMMRQEDRIENLEKQWKEVQELFDLGSGSSDTSSTPLVGQKTVV